jgi:hypothetical protein
MHMMASRGARVARGALTAAASLLVAALAHLAGGGAVPGLVGIVLAAAFAVPASALLAGRTVSTVRLGASVLISQAAFHGLLSLGAASSATVRMAGGHHSPGAHAVLAGGADAATAAAHGMHGGGAMWAAHGAAAALTLIALRHGEQALWDLVALARTGLRVVLLLAVALAPHPDQPRHRVAVAARVVPRDVGVILAAAPRRGPPRLA